MKYLGILLSFLSLLKILPYPIRFQTNRGNSRTLQWTHKWDDVKLGTDREPDFNFWFKWLGHMTPIEIEADPEWALNKDSFDKTKAAVQQVLDYVRMEFHDPFVEAPT